MDIQLAGRKAYYNNGGVEWQPGKPWLCLVHGASLNHTVWVLFTRYFARQGYNVIAPDLIGHGYSEGDVPATIEGLAEWLDSLLEQLGIFADDAEVNIAGHSMGSLVALHAASMRPECYARLLMLGTAVPMPVGSALLDAARDNHQAAVDMVSIFGHSYQTRLGGNPVAGINILGTAMKLLQQSPDGVMYTGLNACNDYVNGLQDAAKVAARGFLILGEEDMMTHPSGARELASTLNADTVTIPECGHMILAERPEATLQAMIKGLAS